jgi:uncharacterized protein DUF3137
MPTKSPDEFREFYDTGLRPTLEELEARRRRIVKRFLLTLGIVALVILGAGLVAANSNAGAPVLIVALILGVITIFLAWWLLTRKFVPEFKERVVGEVARFVDPSLMYSPKGYISQPQFSGSRIFLTGIDRYRGEDHIAGRIGATAIEFSELHAEYKTTTTDGKGRTRTTWHTIFKGLFVIADFNKHFQGTTVVLPDLAEKTFGWLGKLLQKMNIARKEKLVKLEDPEFEKQFVVYGSDQVEARYILSTALMRRILDFSNRQKRPVCISFTGSNVHIAVTTQKNMFEPRIFRTVLDFDLIGDYLDDLQLAIGIVDDLNLNTRIWTKE